MILVFDQMRAEYIDRYDLPNFQRAQRMGLTFDNGWVGHLESNTIISHPVISTGKLPGAFAWGSQIFKDGKGLLGPQDRFYMAARLSPQQWMRLHLKTAGTSSLLARIKKVNSGPCFSVAQKEYSAYNFGGPYADSVISLGEPIRSGSLQGRHSIAGINVPEYISANDRFNVEGLNSWESDGERYSLKGSGYVPGLEESRRGGDAWVGDVVEEIMEREDDWSAIFCSFGAIDKVSHVLAEHDAPTDHEWAVKYGINLETTLRLADKELGRILTRLENQGLMEETVIVITADHGGQKNSNFQGRMDLPSHQFDTYYGKGENFDYTKHPHPVFEKLFSTGKVQAMSLDTSILIWTEELGAESESFENEISRLPGVAEVYRRGRDGRYSRTFRSEELTEKVLGWALQRHPILVDSLEGEGAPNFIAFLFDDTGYGMIGAHGGGQEMVQRIPMIVLAPSLRRSGSRSKFWVRLVDVNPMIGEIMKLPQHPGLDGSSEAVKPFLESEE